MRYFFDTEFIENGKTIDLISIGIVAEDGREFYALNYDCDYSKAGQWVKSNVLPYLPNRNRRNLASGEADLFGKYASHKQIAVKALSFCDPSTYGSPEFWAYYADYDWVAFCQLYGTMMDLPDGFPMYCRDLKQEADRLGIDLSDSVPQENEHHALADARWNKSAYDHLKRTKAKLC